ncbi:MAG: M23 family metallopeptidase [Chloroflexi bacterium]|nr:M23 family metallopeptidase [Chloroflexota bacterium]
MENKILFGESEDSIKPGTKKDMVQVPQTVGSFGNPIPLGWPTDYVVVTQAFGANPELHSNRNLPGHEGLDIRAPLNSKVYACADGFVEAVHVRDENGDPNGRYVTILHNDGYRTVYGHLSSIVVAKGQKVKRGTVIGSAGPTGQTTGGHIHLSLTQQGAASKGLTQFPGDIIDPTPFLSFSVKPRDASSYPWPIGRCLAGAHVDAAEFTIDASTKYVPEAVLLAVDANKELIGRLRRSNPSLFMVTQLQLPATNKPVAAVEWAAWVRPSIQRHVEAGVGYFAVLRAPNLTSQGCGLHWTTGKEFGRWWMDVVSLLKASFPTTKFGFPGLAPGNHVTGQRLDAAIFMEAADEAMHQADWLGVICNWSRPQEMLGEDKGAYYATLRRYYPHQLLFITEFGNVSQPLDASADEAARYLEIVKSQPGIGAAFIRS